MLFNFLTQFNFQIKIRKTTKRQHNTSTSLFSKKKFLITSLHGKGEQDQVFCIFHKLSKIGPCTPKQ